MTFLTDKEDIYYYEYKKQEVVWLLKQYTVMFGDVKFNAKEQVGNLI